MAVLLCEEYCEEMVGFESVNARIMCLKLMSARGKLCVYLRTDPVIIKV